MNPNKKSVLVVGFNVRPLATSLNLAGYEVYAVDFFGDLDLFPYVKDSIIVSQELNTNYEKMKNTYSHYLLKFALKLLKKNPNIEYLIIGSGLDDAFYERDQFFKELGRQKYRIQNLNNDLETFRKARDIKKLYDLCGKNNYKFPISINVNEFNFQEQEIKYPLILKKKKSSGGINIHKIGTFQEYIFIRKMLEIEGFDPREWIFQEYIEGLPISCTVISDGKNVRVISINRQIIGEKSLNAPKKFAYCGNIVPANLLENDDKIISEISLFLTKALNLKGINGFDYVLKDHYPYLMEINPRIPGSLRVSENALNINLMDLHIQSFFKGNWNNIVKSLKAVKKNRFSTKLILFASQDISKEKIKDINKIKHIHDKYPPDRAIYKEEPLCTILFNGNTFADSYFGAFKIVDKIERLIKYS